MLYSEEKKFVYIAVPKTGTTSFEREMQRIDPSILRNHIKMPNGKIVPVNKHITLKKVQALLGPKAREYRYFGFFRNPIDHTISKYFYYTTGRGYKRFKEGKIGVPSLGAKVRFAQFTPRPLWFLIYPLKPQVSFIEDDAGEIALDFCGLTENLDMDICEFLRIAGYRDVKHKLEHLNSAPRRAFTPFERKLIETVVKCRLSKDFTFYEQLRQ